MATVDVKIENFMKSEIPPVCVFTGVPSENVFQFKFEGVIGGLPVNSTVLASMARLRKVVLGLAAVSVVCFVIGISSGSSVAGLLAVGFMIVSLATTFTAKRKLVSGTVHGESLRLKNVHPAFASAVTGPPPGKCSTCPTLADCPSHKQEECV